MKELVDLSKIGLPGYFLDEEKSIVYGRKGNVMKFKESQYGYYIATFTVNGKNDTRKLHRIVAEACLPNPDNYPFVLHKDDNKLNCLKENLEWGNACINAAQAKSNNKLGVGNTKKPDQLDIIRYEILNGGTYQEIIKRCANRGVKLSTGTLTKYKKEMASECND